MAEVVVEDIDGDLAIVADVVGEIDGRRAAGAELALDAISITRIGDPVRALTPSVNGAKSTR